MFLFKEVEDLSPVMNFLFNQFSLKRLHHLVALCLLDNGDEIQ